MANAFIATLRSLRRRPRHERAILAVTTFMASAAIVVVLFFASLEEILSPPAEPRPTGNTAPGRSTDDAPATTKSPPQEPLAMLRETLSMAMVEAKDIFTKIKELAETRAGQAPDGEAAKTPETEMLPPQELPAASTGAEIKTETGNAAKPQAAAQQPPQPPQPPRPETPKNKTKVESGKTETNPGALLAAANTSPPYSSYATARLLSKPLGIPTRQTASVSPGRGGQAADRLAAIISYNIEEMGRAIFDLHTYITE